MWRHDNWLRFGGEKVISFCRSCVSRYLDPNLAFLVTFVSTVCNTRTKHIQTALYILYRQPRLWPTALSLLLLSACFVHSLYNYCIVQFIWLVLFSSTWKCFTETFFNLWWMFTDIECWCCDFLWTVFLFNVFAIILYVFSGFSHFCVLNCYNWWIRCNFFCLQFLSLIMISECLYCNIFNFVLMVLKTAILFCDILWYSVLNN